MSRNSLSFIIYFFCAANLFSQQDLSTKFSSFNYKPKQCNSFVYQTGSIIVIPEEAFVTEQGIACEGDIVVRYREIHHPSQMIANNLNMATVDAKGKRKMLESAGMFEIEAICLASNKKLNLKKGKKIDVYFKSFNPVADVVLWQYSYKNRLWNRKKQPVTDLAANKVANDAEEWGGERIPVQQQGGFYDGDEVYMTPEQYKKYLAEMKELERRDSLRKEVFKSIQIDEMGLFNCDRIISEDESIPLIALFDTPSETKIEKIYIVYRGLNSVIYHYINKNEPLNVSLLKRNDIEIIALDENSTLYQVPQHQLTIKQLSEYAGKPIKFEWVNKGITSSSQELAMKTGMK